MDFEIEGVDAGNSRVKVYGARGPLIIPSAFGEWRERNLTDAQEGDLVVEYAGRKYFAGTLVRESEWAASQMGETKAHDDLLMRVLMGLHQYSKHKSKHKIVVGQPISKHNKQEREKILKLLTDTHTISINGVEKTIQIENVEVVAECASALWANPKGGLIRILDFGSGTIGAATMQDGLKIDRDSFSLRGGTETGAADEQTIARAVCTRAQKRFWNQDDEVYVIGGKARQLIPHVQEYFPKAEVMKVQVKKEDGSISNLPPIYANAVAFYTVAKTLYGVDESETKDEDTNAG